MVEKHNVNVVFLPSVIGYGETEGRERIGDDLEVCRAILQDMMNKEKAKVICTNTADEFAHLVSQLDLLIATRMHPSILASINNVPFISVIYEHKQVGMLEKLGLMDIGVDISDFSYAEFKSKVEYVWNQREIVKKQLSLKIPLLQKQMKTDLREILLKFMPICHDKGLLIKRA
jgi:colanic acid/amylovoran biosynthesis protein